MPPARPNSFPNFLHLRGPATFRAHYDKGHRETAGPLVALALRREGEQATGTRVGFSVPKKFGNSPARNRMRRLLREAFRTTKDVHPDGVDVVFLVRPHAEKPAAEYKALLLKLLARIATRAAQGKLPSPLRAPPKTKPPENAPPLASPPPESV